MTDQYPTWEDAKDGLAAALALSRYDDSRPPKCGGGGSSCWTLFSKDVGAQPYGDPALDHAMAALAEALNAAWKANAPAAALAGDRHFGGATPGHIEFSITAGRPTLVYGRH